MSEDANIDGKKSDNADKIPPSDKPKDKITAFDIPKSDTTLSETPASDNSINNNSTSDTPNGSGQFKKKKSFWSTFFKIYLYLFSSLLLIIVIFVLFAQTSMFKNWALQFGVKKVNEMLSEKDAVLSVGSIEGNVLSHFKLNDVSLVMKNDTLAKFKQLELEYDVFPLLDNSVVVNKLILESPQVNLTNVIDKNGDSLWNIAYLLKSDKEKDTVKKEFDWKINAVTVEIRNGAFRFLRDKNSNSPIRDIPMKKIEHLDISNLDITDFNLSLGGEFSKDNKSASIKNISFRTNSDLNINALSLEASLDKNDFSEIKNLNLITDRTKLNIYVASVTDLNPLKGFDYEAFKTKDAKLDILTDRFNFDDLIFFLPSLDFLHGKVYLNLKVSGKYGDIQIDKLVLKTERSYINVSGNVKNLHEPDKLYLDVHLKDTELDPYDTKYNLPGLSIPDFSHVGKVYATIDFKGEPVKFESTFDIRTNIGNAKGNGALDITQSELVYRAEMTTENFNLGKLIKDPSLESNLTSSFKTQGRGVDYRTLNANISYEMTNSSFFNQKISKSSGTVNINNGNYDLDVNYASNSGALKVQGLVNLKDIKNISYNVKGITDNFDLSTLQEGKSNKTNLNFTFNLKGSGTQPDDITGNFDIGLSKSTFGNFILPETPLNIVVDKNGIGKNLSLKSDFIDFDANGNFSFAALTVILSENLDRITMEIKKRINLDTTGFDYATSDKINLNKNISSDIGSDIDLKYSLNLKSFLPVHAYLSDTNIVFSARLKGEIKGGTDFIKFKADGEIKNFSFKDSTVRFPSALVSFDLNKTGDAPINGVFDFKGYKLIAANRKFDTANVTFNFGPEQNDFQIFGSKDTTLKTVAKGNFRFGDKIVRLNLDSLSYKYRNFRLINIDNIILSYQLLDSIRNINIEKFSIADKRQTVDASGIFSVNGESDLTVNSGKFKIPNIQRLFNPNTPDEQLIKGDIRQLELKYKGTFDNPSISLDLNTEMLYLDEQNLGRLDLFAEFKDNNISPFIRFHTPKYKGQLFVKGSVPFANPLKKDSAAAVELSNKDVSLLLNAENVDIKLLEKFIPVIEDLQGAMNGNINIGGKVMTPILTGTMDISKGSLTVPMTGMNYIFNGNLSTENQKLIIQNIQLKYPGEDDRFINMNGYIDLTNLTLNDIDLNMYGDVKILDNSVTYNELGVYGDLYGGSGTPIISIKGNSKRIDLTGNLTLKKGKAYIPASRQNAYNLYLDNFVYKTEIDSSSAKKDSLYTLITDLMDSLKRQDIRRLDPFDFYLLKDSNTSFVKDVAGKFFYNLSVTSEKSIFVNFIVDEQTRQEFFGNANTNLIIDNSVNYQFGIRGTVDIGDNSFYKFYKNFVSKGYLLFNGDITNPELFIDGEFLTNSADPNDSRNIRNVDIKLQVRGPAQKFQLTWEVLVNGSPLSGDPTDQAISFIVFGKFKEELSASQRNDLFANIGGNVSSNFISTYVSNLIQNVLPFIVNTDINYVSNEQDNFAQSTDIRFTAALGDATIRFGGQILKDLSNTNIVIEYPLNKLIKFGGLSNNLIIQFERLVDPYSENKVFSTDSRTGGKILYKIKF